MTQFSLKILMPAYNEALYVEEAIRSVLSYTFPSRYNITLIVVDDFSTDNTYSIAKSLVQEYEERLIVCRGGKKGKNCAFNMAYEMIESDFTCLLGADDCAVPEILIKRIDALTNINNKVLSGFSISACKIKTFSKNKKYDGILLPKSPNLGSLSGGAIMFDSVFGDVIFPIPESLPNEDTWIGLYIKYRKVSVRHVPDIGIKYRIHEGNSHKRGESFSSNSKAMWVRSKAILLFYAKHHEEMDDVLERKIIQSIVMECLKYLQSSFMILMLSGFSIKDKIKALASSSVTIYSIKQYFYKFIVGR